MVGSDARLADGAVVESDARVEPGAEVAMSDPMLADVLAQPQQLGDALWRVEAAAIPAAERRGGLVVCGMGGSAVGGDLAAAAIGDRATAPLRVSRGYAPGPGVRGHAGALRVLLRLHGGDARVLRRRGRGRRAARGAHHRRAAGRARPRRRACR